MATVYQECVNVMQVGVQLIAPNMSVPTIVISTETVPIIRAIANLLGVDQIVDSVRTILAQQVIL
jgi:hypothetical protein